MATPYGRCIVRISDDELSPEIGAELQSIKRATHNRMRALLEQGLADRTLATTNPTLAAFALAGALNWVSTWYEPTRGVEVEQIADAFAQLFLDGLRGR